MELISEKLMINNLKKHFKNVINTLYGLICKRNCC